MQMESIASKNELNCVYLTTHDGMDGMNLCYHSTK